MTKARDLALAVPVAVIAGLLLLGLGDLESSVITQIIWQLGGR